MVCKSQDFTLEDGINCLQIGRKRRLVAFMLSVFGDESADETKQRVFAIAGVIGTEEAWEALESEWIGRNGGTPFHATDCDSDQGDYASRPHDENKRLYCDLATILAKSGLGGWGLAINLIAQRRTFPDAPDIFSYYKGFTEVLSAMKNCAAKNNEVVKFTFDMRKESDHNAGLLYAMFRMMPEYERRTFSEISFVSSVDHPRVQIADLFARETMKVLDNQIGPIKREPRKSWIALCDTGRFHVRALMDDWFEDLKREMPRLEAETGMHRDKYLAWLERCGIPHSVTNMYRYIQWLEEQDKRKKPSK